MFQEASDDAYYSHRFRYTGHTLSQTTRVAHAEVDPYTSLRRTIQGAGDFGILERSF